MILAGWNKGKKLGTWPEPIVDYLAGKHRTAGLIAMAKDQREQEEAHCFVGLNQLQQGQQAEGIRNLEWIVKDSPQISRYWSFAKAMLANRYSFGKAR